MESVNTFSEGMSSDISKLFQSDKQYLKADNFRPITTVGGSNGALVNIKGNECAITFPVIQPVYKLVLNTIPNTTGIITITVNGQTTPNITITNNTTTSEIVNYIKQLSNAYNGTYDINKTFSVSYNTNGIYITQQPEYNGCNVNSSIGSVITINQISAGNSLKFSDINGTTYLSSVAYITATFNEPTIIIGNTYIGEVNYLFTTSLTNPNKTGQIWEMSYNEVTKNTSLKLLYNNLLNFTKEFPIPPSATVGRYELPTVQRIYWSDNNNPVRSINVKDPNLFGTEVDLINLRPSVKMSVPILSNILQGQAITPLNTTSTYQCAYRLTKINGAVTNYSILSNIVYPSNVNLDIYKGSDINFAALSGVNQTNNKAIQWTTNNIDTSFDTIEFVIVVRDSASEDLFTVHQFDTQSIGNQTSITTVFKNDVDNFIDITLSEFQIENTSFTNAKTLEQKDNRLFYGNVKNKLGQVLKTFDTRTFRFAPSSTNVKIKNFETSTATTVHSTSVDYSSILESFDAIPAYNLGLSTDDDALFDSTYKYQRSSTVLGGTGPNISYKFGSILMKTDKQATTPNGTSSPGSYEQGTTRDDNTSTHLYKNGYRKAGSSISPYSAFLPAYANLAPNQLYTVNNTQESMGFEYYSGTYKSYQHNEIYRFGILFYSKTGTTYFVKWIGDIKFPNYKDSIATDLRPRTDSGTYVSDFRSMVVEGSTAYSNIPYIQFSVQIPELLAKEISGYQIVRVPRTSNDRTIGEYGLLNQVQISTGTPNEYYLPSAFGGDTNSLDPTIGTSNGEAPNNVLTYHPFSYLADTSSSNIADGDKIVATEVYAKTALSDLWPKLNPPAGINYYERFFVKKYYTLSSSASVYDGATKGVGTYKVKEGGYIDTFADYNLTTIGKIYHNVSFDQDSKGSPTIVIATDSAYNPLNFGTYNATNLTSNNKVLGIHFRPRLLKNQYNGRTVIGRSNSEYIPCGAFYNIEKGTDTTINVFGGDIYHGILDVQKAIKDSGNVSYPDGFSQTWFFPTQSIFNIDLRAGRHANSDFNEGVQSAFGIDEYLYLKNLSYENTLNRYIQEPFDFNETNTFFNRVYWSDIKINGETTDSYNSIPVNNYYDVDGNYGGITALITLKDVMYFLQESAVGSLLINPQAIITDNNNQPLKLGNGGTLEKHIYTSVDIGSKHQWSIFKSNNEITFCDIRHNKLYLFDGRNLRPISDEKGNRGFINKVLHDNIIVNDNPILGVGILTTYDYSNNEFLYTFLNYTLDEGLNRIDEKYTLVYSDLIQAFSSFYSFTPYIYVNNHNKLYSPEDYSRYAFSNNSKVYLHNVGNYGSFYGFSYASKLKVNINPSPLYTKVFDNISWVSDSIKDNLTYIDDINNVLGESDNVNQLTNTFTRMRIYNEYQNSDWVLLSNIVDGTLRKSEQGWNIQVPRNKVNYDTNPINTTSIFDSAVLTKTAFGERIRDKFAVVDFEFNNGVNNRFIIHNLKTTYRISDR